MFPTYLAVIICLSVQLSGACFTPGKTWSRLEAEIIDNIIGISSASNCQKECSQSNTGNCSHFTWSTEEATYPRVCTLFQSVPDSTIDCSSCISGPVTCPTCSQPYYCQTNSSTIIDDIFSITAETECQAMCADQDGCDFYTWYNELNPVFAYECFLLTSCTRAGPCQDCVTGPKVCPSSGGGVLFMGGVVNGSRSGNVELIGDCDAAIVDLPEAVEYAAAAIKDGSVFHCGGYTESGYSNRCCFREESGVWTQGPSMNTDRGLFTLNSVGSKLVAIGGYIGGGFYLDTVEVLESSVWQVAGFKINQGRYDHCAVTISDSSVFLIGGYNGVSGYLKTTEELDIDSGAVTPYADLPYGNIAHGCVMYNLQILVSGGYLGDRTSVYSLDYRSEGSDWVLLNHMEYGRYYHTMHVVNGVLTVYGGEGGGESTIEEMVEDSSWKSKPTKNRRYRHSSIVLC